MNWNSFNRDRCTVKLKIVGFPKERDYNAFPFGRRIEYAKKIEDFKASANSTWLSQKQQSYTKAIKDFVAQNNVKEYYARFHADKNGEFDDVFEFYWK